MAYAIRYLAEKELSADRTLLSRIPLSSPSTGLLAGRAAEIDRLDLPKDTTAWTRLSGYGYQDTAATPRLPGSRRDCPTFTLVRNLWYSAS
jgi:hypothetical protein